MNSNNWRQVTFGRDTRDALSQVRQVALKEEGIDLRVMTDD